jgi:hypothetical protein
MNEANEQLGTKKPGVGAIPSGWHAVTQGISRAGDKYWNRALGAWLPVIIGDRFPWDYYPALIRRG